MHIQQVIEKLKNQKHRDTTKKNYYSIWKHFNSFLIRLDKIPRKWEDRTILFCAHLIENGLQSQTIRSYISAIKSVVQIDNYEWNENQVLLNTLTRACRVVNDRVRVRHPIHRNLLEVILFELGRIFDSQPYLLILYRARFSLSYYGLFRVGELAKGDHPVKAKDINITLNKRKILLILWSSKMHSKESLPQKIKISELGAVNNQGTKSTAHFCPFKLASDFLRVHGHYSSINEQFFIFQDKSPVTVTAVREVLKKVLKQLNLDEQVFNTQSFRIGRTNDLLKQGVPIEKIKLMGRWKSNAVFKYIRSL